MQENGERSQVGSKIQRKQFFPFAFISASNLLHLSCNTCIASKNRVFGGRAPTDSIVTGNTKH